MQNVDTFLDGYGRTINVQKQQGPSATNWDTVSTSYFFTGGGSPNQAGSTTSFPCSEANGNGFCSSAAVTQTFHDMLGRVGWTSTPGTGEYVQTQYLLQDVISALNPAPAGESIKSDQKEFNGLGWLLSDCKISPNSVPGTVSCGQKNGSYSGILTSYAYTFATGSQHGQGNSRQ